MNISINEEINKDIWNSLVNYKAYFRFEWFYIIKKSYGFDPLFILITQGNDFALVGSFKTTKGYISMPYLTYSGYFYNSTELHNALLSYLRNNKIIIQTRNSVPLRSNPNYVNSIAEIDTIEEYEKKLSRYTRKHIRKCQKFGFTVRYERAIDNFYRVYSLNMHRLGSPVHKKSYISNIISAFQDGIIITVFDRDKAIGSMLCLSDKDTLYGLMASSLSEYNKKYANYFLYWETIKFLKGRGLYYLDMGRSTFDSGTYHFKQIFKPVNYSIESGSEYTQNEVYGLASKIWKGLPYSLTLSLGPIIKKYLP